MLRRWGRWQDFVIFLLGVWLFISPWLLGFAYNNPYTLSRSAAQQANPWNDWASGVIIIGAAVWVLAITWGYWIEFLLMMLGVWVFLSPWLLGFSHLPGAAWDNWIIGALVFLLAVWSWWTVEGPREPRQTTPRRRPKSGDDRPAST